jgi:hypothetical protein
MSEKVFSSTTAVCAEPGRMARLSVYSLLL